MVEIETVRLRLRLFQDTDLDALAAIYADPDVMRYMRSGQPASREQVAAALNYYQQYWIIRGFGLWAVEERATGRLIGQCGLFHLDNTPEVEVAYLLDKTTWGRGLASEAARASLRYGFEQLGLDRVVAVVRPENVASQRVLEKVGLRYERDARYYDLDVRYYGLGRADYRPDDTPYIVHEEAITDG